ncbi:hypothetical protein [Neobacillus dielmonensis]|uniref:hypothetical protein n=1 Tax=Neobacillus dielmonensis TaxID=1347369 RepID=UPI0005AB19D6|nr:hypothetical protein [Neobacillus dielmonensis]
METFPVIYTNFWDSVIAVPIVVILTEILKKLLPISKPYVPGLANVLGLIIAIFFAHPKSLWAGIFMGFFYGNAASGMYSSLKTQIRAYRRTGKYQKKQPTR